MPLLISIYSTRNGNESCLFNHVMELIPRNVLLAYQDPISNTFINNTCQETKHVFLS